MTKPAAQRLAVGFAALAAAGVIGGATAVSLISQPDPAPQQVRTVSDEASTAPASEPAAPTPTAPTATASPTAAASKPAAAPSTKSTTTRRQTTVTAPEQATADETTTPPGNSAPTGVETPPIGDPPPPLPAMSCLPDEVGQNPRCPATSPTS
ncbi:hypothetical protein ACIBBG_16305 [Micromonospora chersina]|uniref:hypothetical protein n=1 Tax=Micromonospora chersina TaxID=47854 RepID=UPI0037B6754D